MLRARKPRGDPTQTIGPAPGHVARPHGELPTHTQVISALEAKFAAESMISIRFGAVLRRFGRSTCVFPRKPNEPRLRRPGPCGKNRPRSGAAFGAGPPPFLLP